LAQAVSNKAADSGAARQKGTRQRMNGPRAAGAATVFGDCRPNSQQPLPRAVRGITAQAVAAPLMPAT
jgi:hypothetical protein